MLFTDVDGRFNAVTCRTIELVLIDDSFVSEEELLLWYHHPTEEPFSHRVCMDERLIAEDARELFSSLRHGRAYVDIVARATDKGERFEGLYVHGRDRELMPKTVSAPHLTQTQLAA